MHSPQAKLPVKHLYKVTFANKSTGGKPDSWYWDFGDCINSKHAVAAIHTFTEAGKYTVSLTVTNGAGSNILKKTTISP
ncbi:PKD domain-containing protein [Methanosarcina sp. Z-7115]|uniref:PKD domain-containing protein n=1 Tax=Methanosarcina baikalica TaxID=3073890 RepID=A0ABU2D4G5_9EURY|nr:PKD domain-containing protein [Methanosarcina sp. Z-7115]MDR7666884.1 PKD domain-containing protein [Methanosarcina sp. Z-7115]